MGKNLYGLEMSQENHYHRSDVTVTEHKAPTDASVALLKEIEEAATKKMMEGIHLKDNNFECKIYKQKDWMNLSYTWAIVFMLNGKKQVTEYTLDEMDAVRTDNISFKIAVGIRDAIAQKIADETIVDIVKDVDFETSFENSSKIFRR
jgi:hypothetical protein